MLHVKIRHAFLIILASSSMASHPSLAQTQAQIEATAQRAARIQAKIDDKANRVAIRQAENEAKAQRKAERREDKTKRDADRQVRREKEGKPQPVEQSRRPISVEPILIAPASAMPLPDNIDLDSALKTLSARNYPSAIVQFRSLADNYTGEIQYEAEYFLAKIYSAKNYDENISTRYYTDSPIDEKASLIWLRKAALHGKPHAQYSLGLYYLSTGNKNEARKWFNFAYTVVPEAQAELLKLPK